MKNSIVAVLFSLTLAFAAFVAGYYLGNNTGVSQIEVYGLSSTPEPSSTAPTDPTVADVATTSPSVVFPININTATSEELQLLPGIGPVLAQRILDYRTEIGQFSSLDELMDVKGIGEKTYAKILEYITI